MSPRQRYAELRTLVEMLEDVRSAFQADRRNNDDPTRAHQALVDALTILHSILRDMETPHGPRAES